jgi:hypothetical protein
MSKQLKACSHIASYPSRRQTAEAGARGAAWYFSGLQVGLFRRLLRSELQLRDFLFIAAVGVAICFIAAIVMFGY